MQWLVYPQWVSKKFRLGVLMWTGGAELEDWHQTLLRSWVWSVAIWTGFLFCDPPFKLHHTPALTTISLGQFVGISAALDVLEVVSVKNTEKRQNAWGAPQPFWSYYIQIYFTLFPDIPRNCSFYNYQLSLYYPKPLGLPAPPHFTIQQITKSRHRTKSSTILNFTNKTVLFNQYVCEFVNNFTSIS